MIACRSVVNVRCAPARHLLLCPVLLSEQGCQEVPSTQASSLASFLLYPASCRPPFAGAEAKLKRQLEAAAASSSEVLQQRIGDLEEQLRWVWAGICMPQPS